MAYNEKLANRIREALADEADVEEKFMFGGVCFMVKGKMCLGVVGEEIMCRINPANEEEALEMTGSRPMDFTGRPMKGYVFVSEEGLKKKRDFEYWVKLCLDYNAIAKASKKKSGSK